MRVLFLLLLLANLAFFAWVKLVPASAPGTDAKPLATQLEADKIRVLPRAPAPQPAAPAPPSAGTATAAATPVAAAPAPPAGACVEWGSFTLADVAAAERSLEPLALGARLTQRRTEETAGWWVYMPPQGNRPNAQKKAVELKGLGVEEWFIVADDSRWRWAISLGVFRTEEAAKSRLETLRARGVRSALVGEREMQVPKIWLQARNLEPAQLARWKEITPAWPGIELRDCRG